MMIPEFLSPFENELQKYKLNSIKISARPLGEEEESLPLMTSKFLGDPYLPEGFHYPIDENGDPMLPIAQINLSQLPDNNDFPKSGMLQFYISGHNWYDMEDIKVVFHKDLTLPSQTDLSFLTEDLFEESPIFCEHELTFESKSEFGGSEDARFDFKFGNQDYHEFWDSLEDTQKLELDEFLSGNGHKMGGYAFFTQQDPRENQDDVLLLQIDSDELINFGDSGVANFFISKQDLNEEKFENASFNWDCY